MNGLRKRIVGKAIAVLIGVGTLVGGLGVGSASAAAIPWPYAYAHGYIQSSCSRWNFFVQQGMNTNGGTGAQRITAWLKVGTGYQLAYNSGWTYGNGYSYEFDRIFQVSQIGAYMVGHEYWWPNGTYDELWESCTVIM